MEEKSGKEYRIYGPPGTGKTTFLKAQIEKEADEYGEDAVVVTSFTKAAARELVARNLPIPQSNIGTLHAICYRALGSMPVAESKIDEWNASCPVHMRMTGDGGSLDEPDFEWHGGMPADDVFQKLQRFRARMVPKDLWPVELRVFSSAWEDWKQENGYIDFTDMIELANDQIPHCPGNPVSFLVDEAQDLSPLEMSLVQKWGGECERFFTAGDDDQCQPAWTPILTDEGPVSMGDLDMQKHHIISYDAATDKIVGDSKKDAVFFRKSARQYDGWLYSVSSLSEETECTTNHLWTVRWHEEAKNKFCVFFLMAENDIVISFSPLFRLDGSFYPQKEMETHRASNGWVIRVFDTEELARAYASYLLETFTLDTYTSIARCLRSLRRDIRFPFIAKDTEQIRFSTNRPMVVRACNLLNGVMNIPVLRDKPSLKITWGPVSVKSRYVNDITVISLDVPRYKHYVCGSTITHNCIYSFKGASADSFLTPLPEEQKRVLKQSYRLPQSVLKHASRWIERVSRREPKEYRPRNEEGIVERRPEITWKNPIGMLRVIEEALKKENSIMILASCSYMLPPTIKMLRENGIAFHNPWRKSRGDWNPLNAGKGVTSSRRLLSFLVPSIAHLGNDAHMWTREELSDWVFPLATEGVLKRAAKKHILDVPAAELDKELSVADLLEWFEESALDRALDTDIDWYCKHLLPKYQKAMAYPLEIMRRRGVAALSQKPLITIGTIHSVKGGEATHVILYPDISYSGAQEWQSGPDGRDAIVRMFYVGMTRARHTLTLCGPSTPLTVPIDII